MRLSYLDKKRAGQVHSASYLQLGESLMTKLENRCANCGGKFGLICHHHRGLRFCRQACKENFLAKTAEDFARLRKWFGLSCGAGKSWAPRR
jgi:hypothetical protein